MRAQQWTVRIGWVCLLLVSVGILGFGLVVALVPMGPGEAIYRADGVASIGFGLFGGMLTLVPFRRAERWAWAVLWYYPVFWMLHLVGGLPPGTDHVHQVAFIVLSLLGLLLPVRAFFRPGRGAGSADGE